MPLGLRYSCEAARLKKLWVRIHLGACMCVRCVVCCKVEFFGTSWSLVQRSHTDCGTTLSASINILNEDVLVQWELTRQKQTHVFINFVNPFEGVEEFKYLATTLTNQNFIQVEVRNRLSLGNACYHSVQKLLSSRLLSKYLKIKIYRTIILYVVLYGCESWSLTLREKRRQRVFVNGVLRRIFGRKSYR